MDLTTRLWQRSDAAMTSKYCSRVVMLLTEFTTVVSKSMQVMTCKSSNIVQCLMLMIMCSVREFWRRYASTNSRCGISKRKVTVLQAPDSAF
ncbi:hypothetical protein JG688_00003282 [Phytophthora aleatoria]|uniref:Uncharacterized protein n=1 Tax=Phytophthora aleatoria TaxID=2496075 RepID=A0A8J5ITC1_9STRA|nr:hypothetical protein JG688_00003282 [Phytophthora aleatoria]